MATDAMAEGSAAPKLLPSVEEGAGGEKRASVLSSYLGISFALFLGLLPESSASYVSSLQSRNRILAMKLFEAEDQLRQLRSRRREDAKGNARVAEIFAGHRTRWQQEEKRLVHRINAAEEEIASVRAQVKELEQSDADLRADVVRLEREVAERDEMLDFMARKVDAGDGFSEKRVVDSEAGLDSVINGKFGGDFSGVGVSAGLEPVPEERLLERNLELESMADLFAQSVYERERLTPPVDMKQWMNRSVGWQDMQYDSLESAHSMKHLMARYEPHTDKFKGLEVFEMWCELKWKLIFRRECPWKVDGESSGIFSKLKLLEQELVNLEKIGNGDSANIALLMRKQTKRYQSLAGKIDELCRKMRMNDPCDPTLSSEFRTQRQTEFLLEAFRLQHRASETRQKLSLLQAEGIKSHLGGQLTAKTAVNTRSLDSIRKNFKEIQRNLEIWLARIMGDLEGILSREGASRVRDYYLSPYPFDR